MRALLRTGLCQVDRLKTLRDEMVWVWCGLHILAVVMELFRFSLALAGKSDSASSRTVSVRDDAPEPTGKYLWRVLEGVLSL